MNIIENLRPFGALRTNLEVKRTFYEIAAYEETGANPSGNDCCYTMKEFLGDCGI